MAFFKSLDISGSALAATRLRMDIISENIANAKTTRTENGGAYRRKTVVYEAAGESSFRNQLDNNIEKTAGLRVAEIVEDPSDLQLVYDPEHPDANEEGYVEMPNVDPTQEILDMMAATRAYQLNLGTIDAMKQMAAKALEIGR